MSKELSLRSLQQFKDYMLSMPLGHTSPSGREITCRCPFCCDSVHNRLKTSFSINVDPESERFLMYQCFRASCGAHGIANDDFMDAIGYNKDDVIADINSYIASRSINIGGTYKSRKKKEIVNIVNSGDPKSLIKLNYVNNRLGLNLTLQDLYRLKINLNIGELYNVNEIEIPIGNKQYFANLSTYGVSFISAYNDYVIVRDISKNQILGKRYTNINVFNNYDNVTKCYSIPTKLDLLSKKPTVINITEGAFDIIGVYYHLSVDREYDNQIFIAACGSNIINTLKSYIRQYGLLNCKINIFGDADVPIEKYYGIRKLKPYLNKFDTTIYYNTKSKDFGTTKDNISMEGTRI